MAIQWEKSSDFKGPEQSPGFLLWRASLEWRRSIDACLAPLELTQPQFVVLAGTSWLTRNGEVVSQAHVARHVGMDPNTMSQVLRGLERRRFLTRRVSPSDPAKHPRLTPRGQGLLSRALSSVESADAAFFGMLGNDSAVVVRLFTVLARIGQGS